jgi:hypothetical protein
MQGCALILFGIFFSMLLQNIFKNYSESVLFHSDGKLFNIARFVLSPELQR